MRASRKEGLNVMITECKRERETDRQRESTNVNKFSDGEEIIVYYLFSCSDELV